MKSPEQTRRDAMAFELRIQEELRSQELRAGAISIRANVQTVAEFVPEWLEVSVKTSNKASAYHLKRNIVRHDIVPFFGRLKLKDVTAERVAQFTAAQRNRGLAANTVNTRLSTLSALLRCAENWGLIARAPKVPFLRTTPSRFRFLEPFESARLLAAAPSPMWRTMVFLALRTGLRMSELFGLTWENVDLQRRTLHVRQALVTGVLGTPKNGRERQLPLTEDVVTALVSLAPSTGWVFVSPSGRALNANIARRRLNAMCERAGLKPFGWHVLRHTFATQLVGLNAPIRTVQSMLGHSSLEMTMRYSHVSTHAMKATVDLLDKLEERQLRIVPQLGHQSGHSPDAATAESVENQHLAASVSAEQATQSTPVVEHGRMC